jgi:hypothetical protein
MSKTTPKLVCSAAAAIGAAGLLTFAVPAGAIPNAPLAPACSWKLPDFLTIHQDNNIDVKMAINDNKLAGHAQYTTPNGGMVSGSADGALNSDGHTFLFIMRWFDTGGQNNYSGHIDDDGSISGTTLNEKNVTNSWTASPNATCKAATAPAPPPVPAPAPVPVPAPVEAPAPPGHTLTGDVQLWSKAGGPDAGATLIDDNLKFRDEVKLNGPCPIVAADATGGWCEITDLTKNETGAVWGDFVSK